MPPKAYSILTMLAVLAGPFAAWILLVGLRLINKKRTQRRKKWILLKKQQDETGSPDK